MDAKIAVIKKQISYEEFFKESRDRETQAELRRLEQINEWQEELDKRRRLALNPEFEDGSHNRLPGFIK